MAWLPTLALVLTTATPMPPALTPEEATKVFTAATAHCTAEGGRLWGKSLCGPILLVDPASRAVIASQADTAGRLHAAGTVFVGRLPEEVAAANTALEWAGVHWTVLLWPLPSDPAEQSRLVAHELFHRIQKDLSLEAKEADNAHLDTVAGRVWLQLEWRALQRAFDSRPKAGRIDALKDAVIFRAKRWSLFPQARAHETALEKNEGLAEYTGVASHDGGTARQMAVRSLQEGPRQASFVRSFAYVSGPAYGLFLDSLLPTWRTTIRGASMDLGHLMRFSLGYGGHEDLTSEAETRAERYGYAELLAAETRREQEQTQRRADLTARLVSGPVLQLTFQQMNITFDPGTLVPLEGAGTAYPTARVTDSWGVLEVTAGGVLIDGGWSSARVACAKKPKERRGVVTGDGWTLRLTPGWALVPGDRKGDWALSPPKKSR